MGRQLEGAQTLNAATLTAFVARTQDVQAASVSLDVQSMRGGLEAAIVARVGARWTTPSGRSGSTSFVVKRLDGPAQREAELYSAFLTGQADLAPRLLGVEKVEPDGTYLFLEYVRQSRAWPWREMEPTTGVLGRLAALHSGSSAVAVTPGAAWDYESELSEQAVRTLAVFEQTVRTPRLAHLRQYGPALRRIVSNFPRLRRELLAAEPFGRTVVHGDVHSRNVMLRSRAGRDQPVFIDWGRARVGSPLEDVSSWLESLGCWEPEVRRRHDTLLRGYIVARGLPGALERTLRDAYWLASVSNSLSGALLYHLLVSTGESDRSERERQRSAATARLHLRVIRRADALWRA